MIDPTHNATIQSLEDRWSAPTEPSRRSEITDLPRPDVIGTPPPYRPNPYSTYHLSQQAPQHEEDHGHRRVDPDRDDRAFLRLFALERGITAPAHARRCVTCAEEWKRETISRFAKRLGYALDAHNWEKKQAEAKREGAERKARKAQATALGKRLAAKYPHIAAAAKVPYRGPVIRSGYVGKINITEKGRRGR